MSKNLLGRYIWIIDTIRKHGTITREKLNELWRRSPYYTGEDLPRRTFYNYRNAIQEMFNITIGCSLSTYEYYIEDADEHQMLMSDWLMNSSATNNVIAAASDISDRIFLEDVPSARDHLTTIIEAMRGFKLLKFTYSPYYRTTTTQGIEFEPYFLKIFHQRWYVTGNNRAENKIKTYALDRMANVATLDKKFSIPADFNAEAYSRDSYGIVFNDDMVHTVSIKTDTKQAKYFRTLPLHRSQSEVIHDSYSIFTYKLRITPDLVQELLSYGPRITVLSPPQLTAQMIDAHRQALDNYNTLQADKNTPE